MSEAEILQLVGTAAILVIGVLGARVAVDVKQWCSYGRETLLAICVYLIVAGGVRLLIVPFDVLGQEMGRIVSGMIGLAFAAIIVQIVYVHVNIHRNGLTERRE